MTKKYIVLKEQIDTTDEYPISKGTATTALSGKVDKNGTDRLMTAAEGTKLGGIAAGAQVNVLEGIQFNGTDATISSKKVNITPALIGAAASSHQHGNADLQSGIDAAKITVGTLPLSVIPAGAIPTLVVVENTAARLALTIDDVQNGDVVKQNDTGVMYFVKDDTKLGTEAAFEVFKAGEASSVEWANVKNKVVATATTDGIVKAADWTAFNGKQDAITSSAKLSSDLVDDTSKTHKFVTSDQITAWTAKQDALTFDATPTSGSANPVKSGGVYTALGGKVDKETGKSLVADTKVTGYDAHLASTSNPHGVTKAQVGLGNCDNTSDANKPISTATQTALNAKVDEVEGVVAIGKDTNGYYFNE